MSLLGDVIMKRLPGPLALFAIATLFGGLFLSAAEGQVRDDGVDPSTPYGQSVIQNEQYQQQEQQNEQVSRQNQEDQRQRDETFRQQQGYYQDRPIPAPNYARPAPNDRQSARSGQSFGAIFIGPKDPSIVGWSFDWDTRSKARAMAMVQCYRRAGADCKEALVFNNTCGALAVSPSGIWAARTSPLFPKALDDAMDACKRASGQECTNKASF